MRCDHCGMDKAHAQASIGRSHCAPPFAYRRHEFTGKHPADAGKPEPEPRFSHNGEDTIYHQASPNSLRFAFLVVSEFFDTPNEGVTKTLQFICDKLNESEANDT